MLLSWMAEKGTSSPLFLSDINSHLSFYYIILYIPITDTILTYFILHNKKLNKYTTNKYPSIINQRENITRIKHNQDYHNLFIAVNDKK